MQITGANNNAYISQTKSAPKGCPCQENKPAGESFVSANQDDLGLMPKPGNEPPKEPSYSMAERIGIGALAGLGLGVAGTIVTAGLGFPLIIVGPIMGAIAGVSSYNHPDYKNPE